LKPMSIKPQPMHLSGRTKNRDNPKTAIESVPVRLRRRANRENPNLSAGNERIAGDVKPQMPFRPRSRVIHTNPRPLYNLELRFFTLRNVQFVTQQIPTVQSAINIQRST
jgi:hypothetical protein